jgi:hypothetical protein
MLFGSAPARNLQSSPCPVSSAGSKVRQHRDSTATTSLKAGIIRVTNGQRLACAIQAVEDSNSSSRHLQSSAETGMDVAELSVTAELLKRAESLDRQQAEAAAADGTSLSQVCVTTCPRPAWAVTPAVAAAAIRHPSWLG